MPIIDLPTELNYFNYFSEIEEAFIRRRGKHLHISPLDWALIESWKEMQVPLHVALRGIEKAFDSWESKPRKRSVKTLVYCQEEVEAQYAEWLESRVGAAESPSEDADSSIFSREAIKAHLARGRSELALVRTRRSLKPSDELSIALGRVDGLLSDLEKELDTAAAVNSQRLEQSLTGFESMLSEALLRAVSPETIKSIEKEVSAQLKPYRKQMEQQVYQQTFNNLVLKSLRDQFGIPRLSLFYLS